MLRQWHHTDTKIFNFKITINAQKVIADKQFEYYQKAMKALSVTVRIEHGQVLKVIIEDLIKKRNAPGNLKKDSFDDVLMYYLGKEDFEKYVINGEMIED